QDPGLGSPAQQGRAGGAVEQGVGLVKLWHLADQVLAVGLAAAPSEGGGERDGPPDPGVVLLVPGGLGLFGQEARRAPAPVKREERVVWEGWEHDPLPCRRGRASCHTPMVNGKRPLGQIARESARLESGAGPARSGGPAGRLLAVIAAPAPRLSGPPA